jgi:hypothetical protein
MESLSNPESLGFHLVHRGHSGGQAWSRDAAPNVVAFRFKSYKQLEWDNEDRTWTARHVRSDGIAVWSGPSFATAEAAYVHAELNDWGRS